MNAVTETICRAGGLRHNPIYLYGSPLLLSQVVSEIEEQAFVGFCHRTVQTNAEDFSSTLICGILEERVYEVRESFRNSDMFVFENIERLRGKEMSQEEFYGLFDHYYERGKLIIITSSVPPRELHGLEDRVRTQIESGMIFCVDELAKA